MIEALILFATLGMFAGLIAGMFGVGGGIITVPVLVACFIQYGFEDAIMIPPPTPNIPAMRPANIPSVANNISDSIISYFFTKTIS